FAAGMRAAGPVVLGYLGIGIAAGVVERAAGLSYAEVLLISTVLYAGSAQFVVTSMLTLASPASAIVLTVFFLNLRHLLLSAGRDTRPCAFARAAMFAGLLVLQVRIQPRLREALGVALFSGAAGAGIQLAAPGPGAVIGATVLGATLGLALERWKSGPNSSR